MPPCSWGQEAPGAGRNRSVKGDLMTVRRVPVPKEVSAGGLRCVGSFDRWIVGVTPSMDRSSAAYCRDADGGCKSFPACLYAGFEGDLIYFVPDD
ncbi:hypothetical protein U9M48_001637 [Paspalum notatum var. saurae]|uniref:Uncharacterized protein n=1 Tax=Paspalum notatum var. saurae TaxID=547442 RepID=A0AAQ3PJR7_PASNO